jgi:hypothetical protein
VASGLEVAVTPALTLIGSFSRPAPTVRPPSLMPPPTVVVKFQNSGGHRPRIGVFEEFHQRRAIRTSNTAQNIRLLRIFML